MALSNLILELIRSLKLTVPLLISLLTQTAIWIVNSIMMGHLGDKELAAGGLATTGFFLIQVIYFGFIYAVGIHIGHAKGAKNSAVITSSLYQGIYLVIILSIPMGLMLWNLPFIFCLLKQPPQLIHLASQFLHGIAWGSLGMLGFMLFRELFANMEAPKGTMFICILTLPLCVFLDYGLTQGRFGLPAWGMFGIGLANTLVQWFMFLSLVGYALVKKGIREYLPKQWCQIKWQESKHILQMGVPISLTYFLEAGLFNVSALIMGWVGTDALAVHQILLQCEETTFMCFFAIAQTLVVRSASCFGQKNTPVLLRVILINLGIGLLLALSIALIFWFYPEKIANLFITMDDHTNTSLLKPTIQYFHIAAVFTVFDALQIMGNNALRAMKDKYIPVLLSLGSYWIIGIGSAYLFSICLHYGGQGVWFGLTLGVTTAALSTWSRWWWLFRKINSLTNAKR